MMSKHNVNACILYDRADVDEILQTGAFANGIDDVSKTQEHVATGYRFGESSGL